MGQASDAELFLVSLLGAPRRCFDCHYSRWAVGPRGAGTPISLREAGQGQGGTERECCQYGPAGPTLPGHHGEEWEGDQTFEGSGSVEKHRAGNDQEAGAERPSLRGAARASGSARVPDAYVKGRGQRWATPGEARRCGTGQGHQPLLPLGSDVPCAHIRMRALFPSGLGHQPALQPPASASSWVSEALQGTSPSLLFPMLHCGVHDTSPRLASLT